MKCWQTRHQGRHCRHLVRWNAYIRSRVTGRRRACRDVYELGFMIELDSVAFGLLFEYEDLEYVRRLSQFWMDEFSCRVLFSSKSSTLDRSEYPLFRA